MTGQNPFEPPKADVNAVLGPGELQELPSAGAGARFLNFIIDGIVSRMVIVAGGVGVIRALGLGSEDLSPIVVTFVAILAMLGYYVVLEAAFGWTIGKLITGTRVVRFDGDKPHVPQILGRTFARFIPFEPFSVLFSSPTQGWHDSLSGTRVVRVRR